MNDPDDFPEVEVETFFDTMSLFIHKDVNFACDEGDMTVGLRLVKDSTEIHTIVSLKELKKAIEKVENES